jgi:hypothetical protein
MKKIILGILTLVMLCLCCIGCGGSKTPPNVPPAPTPDQVVYAKLQYTERELNVYEHFILPIETEYFVEWSSDNEDVAVVTSDGEVIALSAGKAIITAKVNGEKYNCTIYVLDAGYIPAIKIDLVEDKITLSLNSEYTVLPYVWFNEQKYTDATYVFTSRNTNVATVDQNGKITAVSAGETVLEIKASWRDCEEIPIELITIKVG